MNVGTRVVWTSQASGHMKTKYGIIVAVVAKRCLPSLAYPGRRRWRGKLRDHDSYIVRTDTGKVYWPRVSALALEKYAWAVQVVLSAASIIDSEYPPSDDRYKVAKQLRTVAQLLKASS